MSEDLTGTCPKCNAETSPEWAFCLSCGASLKADAVTEIAAQAQSQQPAQSEVPIWQSQTAPDALKAPDSDGGFNAARAAIVGGIVAGVGVLFLLGAFVFYPMAVESSAEKQMKQRLAELNSSTGIDALDVDIEASGNNAFSGIFGGDKVKSLSVAIGEVRMPGTGESSDFQPVYDSPAELQSAVGKLRDFYKEVEGMDFTLSLARITSGANSYEMAGSYFRLDPDLGVKLRLESNMETAGEFLDEFTSIVDNDLTLNAVDGETVGDATRLEFSYTSPCGDFDYFYNECVETQEYNTVWLEPTNGGKDFIGYSDGSQEDFTFDSSGCMTLTSVDFETSDRAAIYIQGNHVPSACEGLFDLDRIEGGNYPLEDILG